MKLAASQKVGPLGLPPSPPPVPLMVLSHVAIVSCVISIVDIEPLVTLVSYLNNHIIAIQFVINL